VSARGAVLQHGPEHWPVVGQHGLPVVMEQERTLSAVSEPAQLASLSCREFVGQRDGKVGDRGFGSNGVGSQSRRVAIARRGPSQSRRYSFESISTSCRGVQAGGSAKPASSRSRSRLMIASTLPWRPSDTR
jgi:hypothetical protein